RPSTPCLLTPLKERRGCPRQSPDQVRGRAVRRRGDLIPSDRGLVDHGRNCRNARGGVAMTTGRLLSYCKRVCECMGARTVVRWAVPGVAAMTVASICGGDVAHAISIGKFGPPMKIGGMRGGFG